MSPVATAGGRPRTASVPIPLHRRVLPNGLRVLVAPDPATTVLGVAVYYGVGMRSEPPGRTGFAHLFEHVMFQGSANLPKLDHFRYVESSGGHFNGSTHFDYTRYFQVVPGNALSRTLFLEADRMAAPLLDAQSLRLQVHVVKEEILTNVTNKPYGGFPWTVLPGAMFSDFANSHDGYGSFEDLDSAGVADAWDFHERYYAPANALLCICGDVDADQALAEAERHFGTIPFRPSPPSSSFAEPYAERRTIDVVDAHAPYPAVAIGWRVPDPVDDWTRYLAFVVLSRILGNGPHSRLATALVQSAAVAHRVSSYVGLLGDAFDVRDPTALVIHARHAAGVSAECVTDHVQSEIDTIAAGELDRVDVDRTVSRLTTQLFTELGDVLARTQALAAFEQQHGTAERLLNLPGHLARVTVDDVITAAGTLRPDLGGVVRLRPAPDRSAR